MQYLIQTLVTCFIKLKNIINQKNALFVFLYDGITKAVQPTKKLTTPLKSATAETLRNRVEQLGR